GRPGGCAGGLAGVRAAWRVCGRPGGCAGGLAGVRAAWRVLRCVFGVAINTNVKKTSMQAR
ncbi:MAG: hypothetical protein LBC53_05565, partial [Spirochaetaceae bacterium]|nr:hypothetical protein [Spirochaetaceae bacterium]